MPVSFAAVSDRRRGRAWKWVAAAIAVATLVWWAAQGQWLSTSFNWTLLLSTGGRIRWAWLGVCLVPVAACYVCRALRWRVFLRPLRKEPGLWNLFSATLIGFSAIALFGRPGELVRPYLIAAKERVPVASQVAALVLERVFDLMMMLLLFGFAFWRLTSAQTNLSPSVGWLLRAGGRSAMVSCALIFLLLMSIRHSGEFLQRCLMLLARPLPSRYQERAANLFGSAIQGFTSIRSDAALLLVLLYSLVGWGLIVSVYWCLIQSFSALFNLTFVDLIVFIALVSIGAAFQIPGIGGGMQVVAVLVLTEIFHVPVEIATIFAMLAWFMAFVVVVPFGLAVAVHEGLDWRGLRRLGRPEQT
jgi:uncharacterized protein (TIRG00374 family)